MADLFLAEQTKPSTPASGNGILWADSTASLPFYIDDAGRAWGHSFNAAVASQGAGFATDTYVTNSSILIPAFGFQTKTKFVWKIHATKTAAGTASPVLSVRIGANQTTADTARLQITMSTQSADADEGMLTVSVTVRTVSATGVIRGDLCWNHNLASTGFASTISGATGGASAGFDNSALGGSYIGLSIDGGASAAWTITQVHAEASW